MSITLERIFALIEKSGKSDYAIKKETGLKNSVLSEWRAGRANPSTEAIITLANYFNVTSDYLLGLTDDCILTSTKKIEQSINKPIAVAPHFVAHLDFLKTKKSIENGGESLLQKLREFVDMWSNYIDNYANKQNRAQLQDELKFRIFSDNIVMYIPYNRENYFDALALICHCCGYFQYLAFRYCGMMLRGGLCSGGFYADNSFIYGQALVDSYMIEKKVAVYPRIVVTDLLVDQIIKQEKESLFLGFENFIILDPTTQTYYINFLWEHDKNDVQICRQILKDKMETEQAEIKEKIKSGRRKYSDYSAEDNRISQKNNWLLYYINEYDNHISFKNDAVIQINMGLKNTQSNSKVLSDEIVKQIMESQNKVDYIEKIYKEFDEKQKLFVLTWLIGYAQSQGITIKF